MLAAAMQIDLIQGMLAVFTYLYTRQTFYWFVDG